MIIGQNYGDTPNTYRFEGQSSTDLPIGSIVDVSDENELTLSVAGGGECGIIQGKTALKTNISGSKYGYSVITGTVLKIPTLMKSGETLALNAKVFVENGELVAAAAATAAPVGRVVSTESVTDNRFNSVTDAAIINFAPTEATVVVTP